MKAFCSQSGHHPVGAASTNASESRWSVFCSVRNMFLVAAPTRTRSLPTGAQPPPLLHSLFPNELERATMRAMSDTLLVNEVYLSLQGESTFAGLPCVFVRLSACNLRCSYCDTAYAFTEGKRWLLGEVLARVRQLAEPFSGAASGGSGFAKAESSPRLGERLESDPAPRRLPLVELTGGEPLLQPNSIPLMKQLCDEGFSVLIETSGAQDIAPIDPRVDRKSTRLNSSHV